MGVTGGLTPTHGATWGGDAGSQSYQNVLYCCSSTVHNKVHLKNDHNVFVFWGNQEDKTT